MHITEADLKYLCKETGMSSEVIETLTEEEQDLNLLLNQIVLKNFQKIDLIYLGFLTYIKMVLFKYSFNTNYSLEEKSYIAHCVYEHFPRIKICPNLKIIKQKQPKEEISQYYLVLAGLFSNKITSFFLKEGYQDFIADGFRRNSEICPLLLSVSTHVSEWINILQLLKKDKWFDKPIIPEMRLLCERTV